MSQVKPDKKLLQLIKVFENAVRKHEFKGACPPGDHVMIDGNYKKAKKNLIDYFQYDLTG